MKRLVLAAFVAGLLGIGCMEDHLVNPDRPAGTKTPPRPKAPPITPDQVNSANAGEKLKKLEEEITNDTPQPGDQQTSSAGKNSI